MNLYALSSLLAVVTVFGISLFVYLMNKQSKINRSFGIFGFVLSMWIFGCFTQSFTLSQDVARYADRLLYIGVICYPFVLLNFVYAFVRIPKSKFVFRFMVVATVVFLFFNFYDPIRGFLIIDVVRRYPFRFIATPGLLWYVLVSYISWSLIFALYLMWKFLQASTDLLEKQKVKYLIFSNLILDAGGLMYFALVVSVWTPPVDNFLAMASTLIMAYAIVKHQLLDIEIVVKRTAVYSLLIAVITATYLVAVLVIERLFQGIFGYQSVIATVIVAFLIAIFFNPVRNRIQAFVDRLLFKATTPELVEQREKLLLEVRKAEQQKAVATLAAGMAHEIKNPLTAIKTFTEHLPEKFDSEEFRNKFNRIVGGEVERINNIVQQLLDFSKPIPPKLQPVQIHNILNETLEFLNNDFIEHRIEVTKNYHGATTIQGDSQQLKQVFLNLFLNSIQAMNGNGKLNISTSKTDSNFTIEIQDNGSGMSKETRDRLYEPFYTTKSSGTGLGLSVVKGIIKEHGGEVNIQSIEGQGTIIGIQIAQHK